MKNKATNQLKDFWQRSNNWAEENPWGLLAVFFLLVFLLAVIYWAIWANLAPEWTGFGPYDEEIEGPRAKTLWEWFDLLIVPFFLAGGAWLLNRAQKEREHKIAQDNREEEVLQQYFDRMSDLLLKHDLRHTDSQSVEEAKTIARAITLTVLGNLNNQRKGKVLQFVFEAGLIQLPKPVLSLDGADLSNAELAAPNLSGASLGQVNAVKCKLDGASLKNSRIVGAFTGASLRRANLTEARIFGHFTRADLEGAHMQAANIYGNFQDAHLANADLQWAELHADFSGANFSGADLSNAVIFTQSLEGADFTGADLTDAKYVRPIIWPEGFDPKAAGAIPIVVRVDEDNRRIFVRVDEDGNPVEALSKKEHGPYE